ncbi:alpha/beta hydrolase [Kangiella japonica]|uniref:Alpha/beta hydrolase n=1 Tax=Kangiella japonica TaxID=647384 RepID=A0ABN0T2R0_9GAMM
MQMILWGLLAVVGLYVIYVLFFYTVQRRLLFPVHELPAHNADLITQAGGELIRLPFSQGEFELGLLPPLKNVYGDKSPVVMLAHGNGNIIDDWAPRVDYIREQGYSVVLVEYPGYGRSDGKPSYRTIKECMLKAYSWVEQQAQYDKEHISLLGRSMGGGAVLSVLSEKTPYAVILMSTYSSVMDLAKQRWVPHFLVRDPFDNVSALKSYKGRAFLVHGEADRTVPIDALSKLLAAKQDAEHQIHSTGHADTPENWDEFWVKVAEILKPQAMS